MEFSVCIPCFFGRLSPAEAIQCTVKAGFHAVEYWRVSDADISEIRKAADGEGVRIVSLCPDDFRMNEPCVRVDWLDALKRSIDKACAIGADKLTAQVGQNTGLPRAEQTHAIIESLTLARPLLESAKVTLMVEPLNTRYDHPGYFLGSADEGAEIVKELNSPNIRLILDFYHQQAMAGDLMNTFSHHKSLIAHTHIAGNPGRHEPWLGETNYHALFRHMEAEGYTGLTGLEYLPKMDAIESLKTFREMYCEMAVR